MTDASNPSRVTTKSSDNGHDCIDLTPRCASCGCAFHESGKLTHSARQASCLLRASVPLRGRPATFLCPSVTLRGRPVSLFCALCASSWPTRSLFCALLCLFVADPLLFCALLCLFVAPHALFCGVRWERFWRHVHTRPSTSLKSSIPIEETSAGTNYVCGSSVAVLVRGESITESQNRNRCLH